MKVTIEVEPGGRWALPEQYAQMTDEQLITELFKEDIMMFLEGARWVIERLPEEEYHAEKADD